MEYTIIRVYRVPAETQQQATDRFVEARELGVERDYHVRDVIKVPSGQFERLPKRCSWWELVRRQLLGR
ncbi:hypothetical protein [Streptomyces sp. SD31]|uniref:hypothetical protein n=1 Tax=Streptomyces sp. SD31 TaxID=3452208 RepID=UPI003F8B0B2F